MGNNKAVLTALEDHRKVWPNMTDVQLYERLNNELKNKVEEIHSLLSTIESLKLIIVDLELELESLKEELDRGND